MAGKVCVKRIVIDYVADGRPFTITLNPMEIGSIVLGPDDLNRAQAMQRALSDVAGSGVPPVRELEFKKLGPNPKILGVIAAASITDTTDMDLTDEGPSLWWHTNTCTWVHPEEQD